MDVVTKVLYICTVIDQYLCCNCWACVDLIFKIISCCIFRTFNCIIVGLCCVNDLHYIGVRGVDALEISCSSLLDGVCFVGEASNLNRWVVIPHQSLMNNLSFNMLDTT